MSCRTAIAVIGEHVPKKSSPLSFCPTFILSDAYRTPGDADTAFGGSRSAGYVFNIEGAAPNREVYEADRTWVRNFWDAMRPHATGAGGYVNFMVEADEERVRASYGEGKYRRLARIKAEYDPENVFPHGQHQPAPQAAWYEPSCVWGWRRKAAFAICQLTCCYQRALGTAAPGKKSSRWRGTYS